MKITYLPNISNPQKTNTYIPVVTRATTVAATIGTLKILGASPGVASISAGQNIYIDPPNATKTATISFEFPGAIFPFPMEIPEGWLACNGQEVSRAAYFRLYALIGVSYGSGNSRTTFNLPDLRGRTIIGVEDMGGSGGSNRITNGVPGSLTALLGSSGGTEFTTLTKDQVPAVSHTHTFASVTSGFNSGGVEGGKNCDSTNSQTRGQLDGSEAYNFSFSLTTTFAESSATSHSNMPPIAFFNWGIKY
jgi:microcystin-dependent protein